MMMTERKWKWTIAAAFGAFVVVVLVLLGGCTTTAQQDFAVADVRVIALYVAISQPLVEAACDELAAEGHEAEAEQIRVDTRTLADQVRLNAEARLNALRVDNRAVEVSRQLLAITEAILTQIEQGKKGSDTP